MVYYDLQDVMAKDMMVDYIFLVISRYIPFLDISRYLILSRYILLSRYLDISLSRYF